MGEELEPGVCVPNPAQRTCVFNEKCKISKACSPATYAGTNCKIFGGGCKEAGPDNGACPAGAAAGECTVVCYTQDGVDANGRPKFKVASRKKEKCA